MILVNTAHSYRPIAQRILTPPLGASKVVSVDDATLDALADVTRGDWPGFSAVSLAAYGDYLLGSCFGLVTVTYRITGTEEVDGRKVRFQVEPAPELTPLIGRPQPGGPWRRGEARGTRRLATPSGVAFDLYDTGTWIRALISAAETGAGGCAAPQPGPLTERLLSEWQSEWDKADADGIRVSTRSDGVIIVEVPPGRDVLFKRSQGSAS